MSKIFLHLVPYDQNETNSKTALVIYLLSGFSCANTIDADINTVLSKRPKINKVIFIDCYGDGIENIIAKDPSIIARLELVTENIKLDILFINFNSKSKKIKFNDIECETTFPLNTLNEIIRSSLIDIFELQGGLVHAPAGFHYEKPSGTHSKSFIKTANILEHSGGAIIIAFWIVVHLTNEDSLEIKQIIVDTSAISSIGYLVAYNLYNKGLVTVPPIVTSHESYGGLNNLVINDPSSTYLLISASSSGGLRKRLIEKRAHKDKILTIFSLSNGDDDSKILCQLYNEGNEKNIGYNLIENEHNDNCNFCRTKSYPVKLVGSQFLFEPPKISLVELIKTDLDDKTRSTIDSLVGNGSFRVSKKINGFDHEYYLSIDKIWDSSEGASHLNKKFVDEFNRVVIRYSAATLDKIIYTSYPFSKELAENALNTIKALNRFTSPPTLLNTEELNSSPQKSDASSLVITSVLDNSDEFFTINTILRKVHPGGNATYISGLLKNSCESEAKKTKLGLTFGEYGANTFNWASLIDLRLPKNLKSNSWKEELDFLNELNMWAELNDRVIPCEIEERINILNKASEHGLENNLFWPCHDGSPLKIESDFVFIDTKNGTRYISQADIYFTISVLLQKCRAGEIKGKKLSYQPYSRSLISPENFRKFNDAVIQASFLRAAREYELSYINCENEDLSKEVTNLIKSALKDKKNGAIEFLIAIGINRLVLTKACLNDLLSFGQGLNDIKDYEGIIIAYLAECFK